MLFPLMAPVSRSATWIERPPLAVGTSKPPFRYRPAPVKFSRSAQRPSRSIQGVVTDPRNGHSNSVVHCRAKACDG